jgi:hypothetical protein
MRTPQSHFRFIKRLLGFGCLLNMTFASPMSGGSSLGSEIKQDDPTVRVDYDGALGLLRQQLNDDKLGRAEVLHVSRHWVFRTNVSSQQMEKQYDYRLSIRAAGKSDAVRELISTLARVTPEHSGMVADLRWGCIIYAENGSRLFSVFFDKAGLRGVVNGACVNFGNEALREWAEQFFQQAFQ